MKTIYDLIKQRDDYLKKHPHLQPLQDHIDLMTDKLSSEDRIVYLGHLIKKTTQCFRSNH